MSMKSRLSRKVVDPKESGDARLITYGTPDMGEVPSAALVINTTPKAFTNNEQKAKSEAKRS